MPSRWLLIIIALSLLGITACSGAPTALVAKSSSVAHDPALKFDTASGIAVSGDFMASATMDLEVDLPLALIDRMLIEVASDRLFAKDVSGVIQWQVQPENSITGRAQPTAPVISRLFGKQVAVGTFAVSIPGQGTTAGREAIEVVAVDVANGQKVWSIQLPVEPVVASSSNIVAKAKVVSVADDAIIVTAPDYAWQTWSIDPGNRQIRWHEMNFVAGARTDNLVVGAESPEGIANPNREYRQRVVARSVIDGAVQWIANDYNRFITVTPAGPKLIAVNRNDPQEERLQEKDYNGQYFELLDAATGAVREKIKQPSMGGTKEVRCFYDELSTTVCSTVPWTDTFGGSEQFIAHGYDAVTGQKLWSLPDSVNSRIAPVITSVWHGVVYGFIPKINDMRNPIGRTILLDARTGVDKAIDPGIAPRLVNGYVGITLVYSRNSAKKTLASAKAFLTTN